MDFPKTVLKSNVCETPCHEDKWTYLQISFIISFFSGKSLSKPMAPLWFLLLWMLTNYTKSLSKPMAPFVDAIQVLTIQVLVGTKKYVSASFFLLLLLLLLFSWAITNFLIIIGFYCENILLFRRALRHKNSFVLSRILTQKFFCFVEHLRKSVTRLLWTDGSGA